MTNLLASIIVTLVTNVTTTDNAVYQQIPNPCPDAVAFGLGVSCAVHHGFSNGAKLKEATERVENQKVFRVTSSKIKFNGSTRIHELSREYLMDINTTFKLHSEWIETGKSVSTNLVLSASATNRVELQNNPWITMTNLDAVQFAPPSTNTFKFK